MLEITSWDERRDYFLAEDAQAAIAFSVQHWIHSAQRAIQQRGRFAVALSGGSTPKAIYEALSEKEAAKQLDWTKVWLFWSDERAVPPDHPDSNYHMAMMSGLSRLAIPPAQIIRMQAEKEIEKQAARYEEQIRHYLDKHLFDLVMLGVGEDGHTASLFPKTAALQIEDRLVVANHLPEKKSWRMTFTFACINQSRQATIYAIGKSKEQIVPQVLNAAIQSPFPSSRIGTPEHKALWVIDSAAAKLLF
jgi:6-phosphogluconolactonase